MGVLIVGTVTTANVWEAPELEGEHTRVRGDAVRWLLAWLSVPGVAEQTVHNWKNAFLDAGRAVTLVLEQRRMVWGCAAAGSWRTARRSRAVSPRVLRCCEAAVRQSRPSGGGGAITIVEWRARALL